MKLFSNFSPLCWFSDVMEFEDFFVKLLDEACTSFSVKLVGRRALVGVFWADRLDLLRLWPLLLLLLPLEFVASTLSLLQHFKASQSFSTTLEQLRTQSSFPLPSAGCWWKSTNSGWIVVEWMPSLWKNSLMFSAT